jgi:hypothetical protein
VISLTSQGQPDSSYGLEAGYSLPLNGVHGLRSEFHLAPRVSVVLNISYFPSFTNVHEVTAGTNVQHSFLVLPRVNGPLKTELIRFRTYAFADGYYNRWLNEQMRIYLFFYEYNSITRISGDKTFPLPIGTRIGILAFAKTREDEFYAKFKDLTTTKSQTVEIKVAPNTEAAIQKGLDNLTFRNEN